MKILIRVLWISIICFLFLFLTGNVLKGVQLIDDHEILRISNDLVNSTNDFAVLYDWISNDLQIRFRPLYYIHRVLIVKVFGKNFDWLYLYNSILFGVFVSFFSFSLKKIKIHGSIIFLSSLMLILNKSTPIWWRLGPQERIALPIFAICFYFFCSIVTNYRKKNDYLFFFISVVFLGTVKESFILPIGSFILAMMVVRFIEKQRPFFFYSALSYLCIAFFLLIGCALAFTKKSVAVEMGGKTFLSLQDKIMNMLDVGVNFFSGHFGWLALSLSVLIYFKISDRKRFISYVFISLSLIIPQFVLYHSMGMFERYTMPAFVGIVGIFIVNATFLRNNRQSETMDLKRWSKGIYIFLGLILLILSIKAGKYQFKYIIGSIFYWGIAALFVKNIIYRGLDKKLYLQGYGQLNLLSISTFLVMIVSIIHFGAKNIPSAFGGGRLGKETKKYLNEISNSDKNKNFFIPTFPGDFELGYSVKTYLNIEKKISNVEMRIISNEKHRNQVNEQIKVSDQIAFLPPSPSLSKEWLSLKKQIERKHCVKYKSETGLILYVRCPKASSL